MRKILCGLLAAALVICLCPFASAATPPPSLIITGQTTAELGGQITVTVQLKSSVEMTVGGVAFGLVYDSAVLRPVSWETLPTGTEKIDETTTSTTGSGFGYANLNNQTADKKPMISYTLISSGGVKTAVPAGKALIETYSLDVASFTFDVIGGGETELSLCKFANNPLLISADASGMAAAIAGEFSLKIYESVKLEADSWQSGGAVTIDNKTAVNVTGASLIAAAYTDAGKLLRVTIVDDVAVNSSSKLAQPIAISTADAEAVRFFLIGGDKVPLAGRETVDLRN